MPWVRIDDTMPDDPRWDDVGAEGLGLHVAALAYCNRNMTDSELPRSKALRLLSLTEPAATVDALVRARFWELDGETVRLIDGDADKQPSRADVLAARKADADRKATTRERNRRHTRGDHSLCRTDYCPKGAVSAPDTSRNPRGFQKESGSPDPDPTRPEREGREGLPASAVAPLGVAPSRRPKITIVGATK